MKLMLIFQLDQKLLFPILQLEKKLKNQLEKLLAYENANQKCQKAIAPIHETGTIIDYLQACRNLGSETQKMQMLVETMDACFKKGNEGRFTCRDKNHLKKDCPKKVQKKQKQKPPKICPRCCREMHWAKECKSKFDIEGKLTLGLTPTSKGPYIGLVYKEDWLTSNSP